MKIFISSTQTDLTTYRNKIIHYIMVLGQKIGAMEYFGSDPHDSLEVCLEEVKNSDIFICIVAHRYGSIHTGYGKSYTEAEYDLAVSLNKPCFIFLASEDDRSKFIENAAEYIQTKDKINAFRERLKSRHTVSFFDSEDDLLQKFRSSLFRQFPSLKPISNHPDILDCFVHLFETEPITDFIYEISQNSHESGCLTDLEESIDWLEQSFKTIEESMDEIPRDLKNVFKQLDLDENLPDKIPYYKNPLTQRNWELIHIGFPNIIAKLRTLKMLLEFFLRNRMYAADPSDENKRLLEALRKALEIQLKYIHVD